LLLHFRKCNCNHLGKIIANINYIILRWRLYLRLSVSVNVLGWERERERAMYVYTSNQTTFRSKMAPPCKMTHVDLLWLRYTIHTCSKKRADLIFSRRMGPNNIRFRIIVGWRNL
jgi:hypothetical protein